MPHVELSLSEAFLPDAGAPPEHRPDESFLRWTATVLSAREACLVIDHDTVITAVSASCCTLLGLGVPADAIGRPLLHDGLRLLDFTAARGELTGPEVEKIPPLLALTSGRLARGLLRVQADAAAEADATVDAIATPLWTGEAIAGSLTFFSAV